MGIMASKLCATKCQFGAKNENEHRCIQNYPKVKYEKETVRNGDETKTVASVVQHDIICNYDIKKL